MIKLMRRERGERGEGKGIPLHKATAPVVVGSLCVRFHSHPLAY